MCKLGGEDLLKPECHSAAFLVIQRPLWPAVQAEEKSLVPVALSGLHFADADAPYTVTLHPLGVWPFSVLCLGSIAAAWLLFFLGRLAVLLRPESAPARALGRLALVLALVLLTIYDSHTTRRLVPFFIGAMAFAPGGRWAPGAHASQGSSGRGSEGAAMATV